MIYAVSTYHLPLDAASFSDTFDSEREAQEWAKEAAGLRPGTTYYVHVVQPSSITFQATATIEVEAEYVNGDSE